MKPPGHDAPATPGSAPANWQCYLAKKQGGAAIRHYVAAAHDPGRLLGVPRSEHWLADQPRAVPDARPEAIKYAGLPAAFDWSNVTGASFLEPMRDQLTCGSCFAFAGTSMLAARARVRNASWNAANLMLSPQAVVSCSGYNRPPLRDSNRAPHARMARRASRCAGSLGGWRVFPLRLTPRGRRRGRPLGATAGAVGAVGHSAARARVHLG